MTPLTSATDASSGAAPVVLFDLDETLMDHRSAVALGIERHMRQRAYGGDLAIAQARWHELEEQHYHSYLAGELSFEGQRQARARDFAAGYADALDEVGASLWFDSYFAEYRASWVLHDDALPTLDALACSLPGAEFGIITNGELDFQTAKLERLGLMPRFAHVIASGEVGVTKPDRAIFEHALAQFKISVPAHAPNAAATNDVRRAAYIGDRLATDAIGAARAGLLGIWLNRSGVEPEREERAAAAASGVLEIRTLAELPELLAEHRV